MRNRILILAPYPIEGASVRYRVYQYLPYLKEAGFEYDVETFITSKMYGVIYKKGKLFTKVFFLCKALWRRFWVCVCLWKYQMIYIHLESSPLPFLCLEKVARFLKKPIIYDLDDAIFLGKNKGFRKWVKSHIKIPKQISYSQEIIVCNEFKGIIII